MTFKPRVIKGGRSTQDPFVCGWCGATFATRYAKPRKTRQEAANDPPSLEAHFLASPVCGKNRNTNNQTQTKYRDGSEE